MKKISFLIALLTALALVPDNAEARRRGGGSFGGAPGASTFGLGLILGSPTGLSGELRLSPRSAIDFAIGLNLLDDNDHGLAHIDYLAYLADLSRGGTISVPIYLGIGLVIWEHNHGRDDDLHFGVRFPLGIAIALRTVPVQFFFEGAIRVLFYDDYDGDDDDDSDVDLTGGLGFRVYF